MGACDIPPLEAGFDRQAEVNAPHKMRRMVAIPIKCFINKILIIDN
jgi:hypothetical protein